MKILILGGAGFIGTSLTNLLLSKNFDLRILKRLNTVIQSYDDNGGDIELFNGDFLNKDDLIKSLDSVDIVVHLISSTMPKGSNDNPVFDTQTNLIGTLNLLDSMVMSKSAKKIIFISSGGTVYGNPLSLPIDESHPLNPQVSYGINKLAIEKYLSLYKKLHGINYIILRVSNPYGKFQNIYKSQGAVGVFINRALNDLPIEIWGDGSVVRDYIHVTDVSKAILKSIEYKGDYSIFNVGSGCGVDLNYLLSLIKKISKREITINYTAKRSFDVAVNYLSIQLASEELDWQPLIDIEHGLLDTIEWFKKSLNNSAIPPKN
jgi:UDP-glucose 4-epimerase